MCIILSLFLMYGKEKNLFPYNPIPRLKKNQKSKQKSVSLMIWKN